MLSPKKWVPSWSEHVLGTGSGYFRIQAGGFLVNPPSPSGIPNLTKAPHKLENLWWGFREIEDTWNFLDKTKVCKLFKIFSKFIKGLPPTRKMINYFKITFDAESKKVGPELIRQRSWNRKWLLPDLGWRFLSEPPQPERNSHTNKSLTLTRNSMVGIPRNRCYKEILHENKGM